MNRLSNRIGMSGAVLMLIGTMTLMPSAVAGFFGMNFRVPFDVREPGASTSQAPFIVIVCLMVAFMVLMGLYVRHLYRCVQRLASS